MRFRYTLIAALALMTGCTMDKQVKSTKSAPGAKITVAEVGMQNDQFYKLVELGMKGEADKLGVAFQPGNSGGTLDKEISLIDTYISQRVNAIVAAPCNPQSSVAALKRASDAGIKVIIYDTGLAATFPASDITSDQESLGHSTGVEAANYITARMGGKAKVAVVTYLSQMPQSATERNKGFLDEMKKLPGVEIVATQDAWMAEKAVTVIEAILTAHPDVNMIWAANEGGTVGAVTAVRNAGKGGKIVVFGTDMSEQMADFLLAPDNILQAVTGQKPVDIGTSALEAAVKSVKGEPVEKKVRLPGLLFSRSQPAEVTKYRDFLRGIAK